MDRAKSLLIPIRDIITLFLLIELTIVPLVPFFIKILLIGFILLLLLVLSPKVSLFFLQSIRPLIYILIVAILMGFQSFLSEPYNYIRDGYYFFQPILLIFLGYSALSRGISFNFLLRLMVFSSIFLTFYFYIDFILSLFLGQGLSFESRYIFGLNSDFAIIGFLITYASYQANFKLFQPLSMTIILTTLFFLIMISFSRTNILITLVIIIYPYISKLINFKTQLFLVSVLIIIPVFFGSFLNVAIPEEGASNFLSKVLNSYSEIIVRDYRDSDALAPDANLINLYWRSQEAFLGLAKYTEGSTYELIFGQGLGSYASAAGIFENKFQQIPFFHNGFITILLKSGPLGVLLFFQFLYLFVRNTLSNELNNKSEEDFIRIIAPSIVFITILKTFFIMGFYTPESPVLLLTLIGIVLKKCSDINNKNII